MLTQTITGNMDKYRNYPLRSLREMCRKRDAMQIYDNVLKKCNDFREESDFDMTE